MRAFAFKRLVRDESGSIMPMVALVMVVLGGVAALAIDAGSLYALDNKLQSSADAAALAAISQVRGTPQEVRDAALAITATNLPAAVHGSALAESDIEIGEWDPDARVFTAGIDPPNAVRVIIRRTTDTGNPAPAFFAHLMGIGSVDIVAEAIAAEAREPVCVLSLAPDDMGIFINSNSELLAHRCSAHVHSADSSTAIDSNSGSSLTAAEFCVKGDYSGRGYTPAPETGCDPLDDPLAELMPPSIAGDPCDYSDTLIEPSQVETLYPGVYCDSFEINGGTAYFEPGIYVFDDIEFKIASSGTVIGDGVSIYLTGDGAHLDFNSSSTVQLSAPTIGEMAGILIFEDRSNSIGNAHTLNSSSTSAFEGTVYLPRGTLMLNNSSDPNGSSPYTAFIAYRFDINSSSILEINTDFADSDVPLPSALGPGSALRL